MINRSIYDHSDYVDQYLNYRNATYLQGARFFEELRNAVGDEQMEGFLRDYAATYKDKIVTEDDFFALLGDYVELNDLDWLGDYFAE